MIWPHLPERKKERTPWFPPVCYGCGDKQASFENRSSVDLPLCCGDGMSSLAYMLVSNIFKNKYDVKTRINRFVLLLFFIYLFLKAQCYFTECELDSNGAGNYLSGKMLRT